MIVPLSIPSPPPEWQVFHLGQWLRDIGLTWFGLDINIYAYALCILAGIVVAVIVAILTVGYMLPWAIAAVRDVPHWGVFWVNLLLGWTLIGWVIALIMSLRRQRLIISPS